MSSISPEAKIYDIGEIEQRNTARWILGGIYIGIPLILVGAFLFNVFATNQEFFGNR